ncbi:hypothetical protein [Nocardioides hungaricus]
MSVLIVTSLALVIGKGSDPAEPRKSDRSSDTVQTIIIDKVVGETFTPATDEQIAANRDEVLSSAQAWARFSPDGAAPPPDANIVQGFLTLPLGAGSPGEYTAKDLLVYAFSWKQCGPQLGQPVPVEGAEQSPAPELECTQWIFLDAKSGDLTDLTWS